MQEEDAGAAAGDNVLRQASRPTVSVVIPTLNEAESLDWVLEQIPAWVSEVVLVDGLSTDHTEVIARGLRTDVTVVHQSKPGKGAALRAGFAAASGEIVVMVDGDGSTHPGEMERFVQALLDGAQFVKGSRHLGGGGSDDFSLLRRFGNHGFVALVNLLYGCRFTDLCYGYCAFWRRHLDVLDLSVDGFEIETQLVLSAVRAGLEIREVPSFELPRRHGKSNLNAFSDGRSVLRTILRERWGSSTTDAVRTEMTTLVPVVLPAPGSPGWMPAGHDRRQLERRSSGPRLAYGGPERRCGQRRDDPTEVVVVYRARHQPAKRDRTRAPALEPAPALELSTHLARNGHVARNGKRARDGHVGEDERDERGGEMLRFPRLPMLRVRAQAGDDEMLEEEPSIAGRG